MLTEIVWNRLSKIASLSFEASSSIPNGWNGSGIGIVVVESPNNQTLLFRERGQWSSPDGRQLTFSNVYRWSRDTNNSRIRLEHLRFGPDQPVYLFELAGVDAQKMISVEPHVCSEDLYSAQLVVMDSQLNLDWTVTGPKKNETIKYAYA